MIIKNSNQKRIKSHLANEEHTAKIDSIIRQIRQNTKKINTITRNVIERIDTSPSRQSGYTNNLVLGKHQTSRRV